MDVGLYEADNTLITRYANVLPRQEAIKVKNRTLDGQMHVQIIGTAVTLVDVELFVYAAGKAVIDTAEATGALVKVSDGTTTWTGTIAEPPWWEKKVRGKGLYAATIIIEVTSVA